MLGLYWATRTVSKGDASTGQMKTGERSRHFSRRHPVWVFVVAPIPLTFALMIAFVAAVVGVAHGVAQVDTYHLGYGRETMTRLATDVMAPALEAVAYLPFAVAAALLCWLARRNGVPILWPALGCLILALLAGILRATVDITTGTAGNSLSFGVGCQTSHFALTQFLVPLAVGLAFLARRQSRSGQGSL